MFKKLLNLFKKDKVEQVEPIVAQCPCGNANCECNTKKSKKVTRSKKTRSKKTPKNG